MNFLNQGNLRFVATLSVVTCLLSLGTISPATAQETIGDISQEVFNCLKRNNVNDEGFVIYENNGDMRVGPGKPDDSNGYKMRYSYNQEQGILTLEGTGGWDPANVLGRTRDGISRTAEKCRKGELR